MAKHFYHIPLRKALNFIKEYKSKINSLYQDKKKLIYYKELGKSYYNLQIESFLHFFKIDKNLDYTLKSMEYFHSTLFIDEMYKILNFSQFDIKDEKVEKKAFFYAFCYLFSKKEQFNFELFIQKTFLHYHTSFNTNSNIQIDHQDMCHSLAKTKKVKIKESFGEDNENAFFKLLLNEKIIIQERGKRIKTLRKKAYKRLFYYLIELEESKEIPT